MNYIIFIPARSGSKRLANKNIYPLLGKPLLSYKINNIIDLNVQKITYISTNSEEISLLAKDSSINIHKRPEELCNDLSSTESGIIHLISILKNREIQPDFIVTLPPTSPLLKSKTILLAIDEFIKNKNDNDSLISVTKTKGDYWYYYQGEFIRIFPNAPRRQQDRNPIYVENSAIYITKTSALLETNSILGNSTYPFEIDNKEGLDINTLDDIKMAEYFLKD